MSGNMHIEERDSTPSSRSQVVDGEVLFRIVQLLWSRKALLIGVALLGCVLALVYAFLMRPVYVAEVSILPEPGTPSSGLLGSLNSLMGTGIGMTTSYEDLYKKIVKSDRILDRCLARKWNHREFQEEVTLFEIFGVGRENPGSDTVRSERLRKILRNRVVNFSTDKTTGFMVLRVNMPGDGNCAADLANFLVQELNSFNLEIRSGKAEEQYRFLEDRLAATLVQLEAAENRLTTFLARNRSYAESPQLVQEFNELSREVQANTTIWVELRKQLELAGIERNQKTTAVQVLDRARPPHEPEFPRKPLYGMAGLVVGFLLAAFFVLLRHQVSYLRSSGSVSAG